LNCGVFAGILEVNASKQAMMEAQYKIIGGDGAEYGPASLAELQDWIRDGRVARATQVWRDDLSRWSPADRYVELQTDLTRLHATNQTIAQSLTRPAGFWARLGAYLLDRAALLPIFAILWFPIANAEHWQTTPPPLPTQLTEDSVQKFETDCAGWADREFIVWLPLLMVYEVFFNGRFGATLGKMAIGARIRQADGGRLTYSRAMLRWWAERLSEFMFYAGFLIIAIRPDKRGLHDLLAGTKVVYQR
jgi:uncharacterized RDD family membrane protein YckC